MIRRYSVKRTLSSRDAAVIKDSAGSLPVQKQPPKTTRAAVRASQKSPWSADDNAEARHLLRAILRESSYLPDPHARKYVSSHALSRFRDYTLPAKPLLILLERRKEQVKLARKALSEVRRANAGELKVLTKILHLTYGRTGKRRHELLQPLLVADNILAEDPSGRPTTIPNGKEEVAKHAAKGAKGQIGHEGERLKDALPRLSTKLRALLGSQMSVQPPEVTRPHPRALTPKIPEKNTWLRPMPWKRVKNSTKEWYATVLDRAMPPLETQMWEELRDRAFGNISFEPVKRRARATSALMDEGDELKPSVKTLEKELLPYAVKTPEDVLRHADDTARGRALTKRFMQRRWATLFAHCAKMEWDNEKGRWIVTWGVDVLQEHLRHKKVTHPPSDD